MLITKTITEIKEQLQKEKKSNHKIAFVPTMGALHEGHLALVKKARELADVVVVSIFVNKAQFNDPNDYEKYPRQVESDLEKLKIAGVNYVFTPNDSEIFTINHAFKIIPTALVDCLCGASRPGHFDGVALIITKLFNIVKPDVAIFGKKDFQQVAVIKKLVADLNFDVEIFASETLREKSGLAMSSRNQRLDEASKIKAAEIYKILLEIQSEVKKNPLLLEEILQEKKEKLLKNGFEKVDYLEVRDEENLKIITNLSGSQSARIFIATYLSKIRLIDNISL